MDVSVIIVAVYLLAMLLFGFWGKRKTKTRVPLGHAAFNAESNEPYRAPKREDTC